MNISYKITNFFSILFIKKSNNNSDKIIINNIVIDFSHLYITPKTKTLKQSYIHKYFSPLKKKQ